jgi:CDP-ribitol ribitolphosphotransferase
LWPTVLAGYRLATAQLIVVDDAFFPLYVVPRLRNTTVVQVWHACGAFKKFGYSVLDKSFGATEEDVRRWPIHTNYDICLVSSRSAAPAYAEAFRQPLERFVSELGIPRTDVLVDPERSVAAATSVRARYGLPTDRRLVLYAPTFRGDHIVDARDPTGLDIEVLRRHLGADHLLLVRSHPLVRDRLAHSPSPDAPASERRFTVDVSDHPDMNELLLVADVLITDYSSAIFEFALLGRPIVFFAPDRAAYERERGFYFDFSAEAPGPIFETTEPLAAYLRAGQFDTERVRHFAKGALDVADGRATARFVDRIVVPATSGVAVRAGDLRA